MVNDKPRLNSDVYLVSKFRQAKLGQGGWITPIWESWVYKTIIPDGFSKEKQWLFSDYTIDGLARELAKILDIDKARFAHGQHPEFSEDPGVRVKYFGSVGPQKSPSEKILFQVGTVSDEELGELARLVHKYHSQYKLAGIALRV